MSVKLSSGIGSPQMRVGAARGLLMRRGAIHPPEPLAVLRESSMAQG